MLTKYKNTWLTKRTIKEEAVTAMTCKVIEQVGCYWIATTIFFEDLLPVFPKKAASSFPEPAESRNSSKKTPQIIKRMMS